MADQVERLKAALANRYNIEREIGAGGMATVYLAEDLKHHRKVAVKQLRPELAASLGLDRFIREIEIAANLTHPHILPLFDSGEANGFLYYVMPFVEGESLRDRLLREKKLSVHDAIRITEQVASALSHAHERGVVHRDIKPENILCSRDQAIVADFGIARAVEVAGAERLTGTGIAIGTPAYMSPEQAVGDANVDGRSDVYALGCVVYEMVAGRTPFEGATAQALLAKHAVDTAPGLRTIDPDIPLYVERAVSRALAKDPAQRFETPNEFAATLTSEIVVARVGKRRLAVLPPINLMNDPEQEYFVQGMHNALISELQRAGVVVIARTSVLQYRDTQKPIRQIAAELGVDALVEPSVFRAADSVELEVRLVDGNTEEYFADPITRTGQFGNVVAMYRELTRAIATEIQATLTPQVEAHLASAHPVNSEAYEAYLKGQFHWYRVTAKEVDTALHYFDLARKIDPDYALAYAGIATVWGARMQMGLVPSREAWPKATAAVAKAVELDSTLVEVQYTLAIVTAFYDWDWQKAGQAFQRAIKINPNYPDVRAYYSHFLYITGRPEEAMEQIGRARELDPFNSLFQAMHGMDLHFARRYDDALTMLRDTLAKAPNDFTALAGIRTTYHLLGRFDDAIEAWRASFFAAGDRGSEAVLMRGYTQGGYSGALTSMAEVLIERSRTTYVTPWQIATLYTRAGRHADAIQWLQQAYDAHDVHMPYISVDPIFDPLRDDPRFQALLRCIGLRE